MAEIVRNVPYDVARTEEENEFTKDQTITLTRSNPGLTGTRGLDVSETLESTAAGNLSTSYTGLFALAVTGTANISGFSSLGASITDTRTSGNATNIYGISNSLTLGGASGTAKASSVHGYSIGVRTTTDGYITATTTYGIRVSSWEFTSTNSSYTTAYGINLSAATGARGTNKYGIYVGDVSGAATLNYAIYTNAGDVSIGGAAYFRALGTLSGQADVQYDTSTKELGYVSSTRAVKENISYDNVPTEWIYDLMPVKYDRKDGSKKNEIGLIAEDVETVAPTLVCYDENGKAVTYTRTDLIIPMLNELIKLEARVTELEKGHGVVDAVKSWKEKLIEVIKE